jgi:hypothetical protein
MQYSADVWADWNLNFVLNSIDAGGLEIAVEKKDPPDPPDMPVSPYSIRTDHGGSALDNQSGSIQNDIQTGFKNIPWQS